MKYMDVSDSEEKSTNLNKILTSSVPTCDIFSHLTNKFHQGFAGGKNSLMILLPRLQCHLLN